VPVGVTVGRGGLPAAVTVANRLTVDDVALSADISCEALLVSGGWSPNVALAAGAGATLAFDPACGAFRIADAPPGVMVAGAADGCFNMSEALDDGWRAGIAAAAHVRGRTLNPAAPVRDCTVSADPPPEPVAFSPDPATPAQQARAMVDVGGDVSVRDIAVALTEGYEAPDQLARYTGLGRVVGDESGPALAAAVAARLTGLAPAAPPAADGALAVPISLGALARNPAPSET
jgi:sarcosine oxidase subunit alpha